MSQSLPSVQMFRSSADASTSAVVRADATAPAARCSPHVLIATINPAVGDTGVQTHTRTLHAGLVGALIDCDVITPFARRAFWLPIFGVRKLIEPLNRSWSTRWYRHWHAAALREALMRQLMPFPQGQLRAKAQNRRVASTPGQSGARGEIDAGAVAAAPPRIPTRYGNPGRRGDFGNREMDGFSAPLCPGVEAVTPPLAILAQCPVSAAVALDVRARLGANFPVAMVCHFNFSEAKEYRDKGELPNEKSYHAMLDFERRVLGEVDRIIYVSSWAKRIVEEKRGIHVRSSAVIWNGIAPDGMQAVSRADLDLKPDDLVLMNVGTLEKRKNQLGLIELFAAIAEKHPEAKLVLVGDGPHRADIRNRIAECGLTSRVRMLGMRHDVPALLGAADLYVHYAAMENCPVVLLEAARAALPIAAVAGGGVPELLDVLGGATLDSDDIKRSLDALHPLLAIADARHRAGQIARTGFERTFTRDAMVAAYLKAIGVSVPLRREVRT